MSRDFQATFNLQNDYEAGNPVRDAGLEEDRAVFSNGQRLEAQDSGKLAWLRPSKGAQYEVREGNFGEIHSTLL
jgi:hypothetical protein